MWIKKRRDSSFCQLYSHSGINFKENDTQSDFTFFDNSRIIFINHSIAWWNITQFTNQGGGLHEFTTFSKIFFLKSICWGTIRSQRPIKLSADSLDLNNVYTSLKWFGDNLRGLWDFDKKSTHWVWNFAFSRLCYHSAHTVKKAGQTYGFFWVYLKFFVSCRKIILGTYKHH